MQHVIHHQHQQQNNQIMTNFEQNLTHFTYLQEFH